MTRLDPEQRYTLLAEILNYATQVMCSAPLASDATDVFQGDGSINLGLQDRAIGAMSVFCEARDDCSIRRRRRRQTVVGFEVEVSFLRPREQLLVGSRIDAPGQVCLPWRLGLAYLFKISREGDQVDAMLAEFSEETGEVLRTWEYPFVVEQPESHELPAGDELDDRGVDFGTADDETGEKSGE